MPGSRARPAKMRSRRTTSSTPATTRTRARCSTTGRSTEARRRRFPQALRRRQAVQDRRARNPRPTNRTLLSVKLKPGLIKYKVEFGSKTGDRETVLHTVGNLVCGDAYLINGQSNAVATDFGKDDPALPQRLDPQLSAACRAARRRRDSGATRSTASRDAEKLQIGYWGMELGRRLVENQKIPICLINGAVGGTRIDQHQRNAADPEDMTTIYGRLLWRVRQARLTHGIRGVLWHQGENDQGADGPTGGFGWETYRQYFIDLAAAWKQDYPEYPALLRLPDLARDPARWASTAPTTACAKCSARCRRRSPT